ncbi:MAG: hypothetical protein GYA24_06265 [Candidatus Lokiarchaeota archaeon]|nr:hypothetical protein [Candidatus Lokiarchaeota archaeon]
MQRTIPIQPYRTRHEFKYTPWLVDDPFSPDGRWVVDDPEDGTLVVRAFDPGRDRHPCDIIKE